jgi:dephospho-CoA kinase
VARVLTAMGVPVYISDDEAKRLTLSNPDLRRGLTALVGDTLYEGGVMHKEQLAAYLFASHENAARVNAVVHPAVKSDFRRWAEQRGHLPVVAIESAILIEAGFTDVVDRIVMVDAPLEVRIERAMQRDGATRAQIESRVRSQMDDEAKRSRSDYVIVNDGSTPLIPQLLSLLREISR